MRRIAYGGGLGGYSTYPQTTLSWLADSVVSSNGARGRSPYFDCEGDCKRVNRDRRAELLILARGGGAVEDLSCFNDSFRSRL